MKQSNSIFFLGFLFFFLSKNFLGQNSDSTQLKTGLHRSDFSQCGHNITLTTALHIANYSSAEISLSRGYSNKGFIGTFSQYGLGIEFIYTHNRLIYLPKISCELDGLLPPICVSRMNLLYATDFGSNGSLKYRHEIGYSYRGIINITYSYTFNITEIHYLRMTHGINLQWNIFLGKRKWDRWA